MKTKEAKEASGKYALCLRVGRSLLPTGGTWNTLEEAVAVWRETDNASLIIGCCCRWKRRWEEPEYNPLPPGDSDAPIDPPNVSPDPFFEGIDNT